MTNTIEYTTEQQFVITELSHWLRDWYGNKQNRTRYYRTLGGLAGTGKTTVIKGLISEMTQVFDYTYAVAAFTGKAVSVLRRKGVPEAQTLHSLIYRAEIDDKGVAHFYKRAKLVTENDDPIELVIVDEASMVNTELYHDLISYSLPVIFVGDYGQLEPVGDNPKLMQQYDLRLTDIHRQAAQNPIIKFARDLRVNRSWPYGKYHDDNGHGVEIVSKANLQNSMLTSADQVICATNATRRKLNAQTRSLLGKTTPLLAGDKTVCLQNNREYGVFNGMTLWVQELHENDQITFHDDLEKVYSKLPVQIDLLSSDGEFKTWQAEYLKTHTRMPSLKDKTFFNSGYALTCHKSQGSEWDTVLVYEQYVPMWDMKCWQYTAATRAAKTLIYVR